MDSFEKKLEAARSRAKLGTGKKFELMKKELAHKGAENPAALTAWIGRKKYGNEKFQKLAKAGKKA
jgi:hypothetical protein